MDVEEVLLPAPVVPFDDAPVFALDAPVLAEVESIEPEVEPEAEPLSELLDVVVDEVDAPVVSVVEGVELVP